MDLVIQGFDIETHDLKEIAKLARASGIERLADTAFALKDAQRHDDVASVCERARLDFAYVPEDRKLEDFRLLVMDMDSTLITIETIDELADLVGLKAQVAAITESAMRGEIEYNESLRRRVAVLKDLGADALQRVYDERVRLTPGADKLLARVRSCGLKTLLVSGGFTYVTDRLQQRLGLDYTRSNCLEIVDGRLTGQLIGDIVNADGKRDALLEVRERLGITKAEVIGIGDGANDLEFMAECGVSIAYHAKPIVRGQTTTRSIMWIWRAWYICFIEPVLHQASYNWTRVLIDAGRLRSRRQPLRGAPLTDDWVVLREAAASVDERLRVADKLIRLPRPAGFAAHAVAERRCSAPGRQESQVLEPDALVGIAAIDLQQRGIGSEPAEKTEARLLECFAREHRVAFGHTEARGVEPVRIVERAIGGIQPRDKAGLGRRLRPCGFADQVDVRIAIACRILDEHGPVERPHRSRLRGHSHRVQAIRTRIALAEIDRALL